MTLIDRINQHHYLYLTHLSEPEDNVLRLIVTEGRVSEDPKVSDDDVLAPILRNTHPILADERCAAYEILFNQYRMG